MLKESQTRTLGCARVKQSIQLQILSVRDLGLRPNARVFTIAKRKRSSRLWDVARTTPARCTPQGILRCTVESHSDLRTQRTWPRR
jgi:hypothetical protein